MHTLICSSPFSSLPLHVRCFTEHAHSIFDALPPTHLEHGVGVILDLGGVSGSTGQRRESTSGALSREGPIDVQDSEFRGQAWDHWVAIRETVERACSICKEYVDPTVSRDTTATKYGLKRPGVYRFCSLHQSILLANLSPRLLRRTIRR